MNKTYLVLAVVIIAAVAGLGLTVTKDDSKDSNVQTNQTAETSQPAQTSEPAQTNESSSQATITYTDSGFTPESINVAAGTTITIKNDSSADLDFASDDHPAHRDNSELNVGMISPGESKTFSISKSGTWGFHNHLNDNDNGKIAVD